MIRESEGWSFHLVSTISRNDAQFPATESSSSGRNIFSFSALAFLGPQRQPKRLGQFRVTLILWFESITGCIHVGETKLGAYTSAAKLCDRSIFRFARFAGIFLIFFFFSGPETGSGSTTSFRAAIVFGRKDDQRINFPFCFPFLQRGAEGRDRVVVSKWVSRHACSFPTSFSTRAGGLGGPSKVSAASQAFCASSNPA